MKLIHYLSKRYIIYSACISIIAIPLFYLSLQYLLLGGLDEGMRQQKKWIETQLNTVPAKNFVSFENEITVTPSKQSLKSDVFSSEPIFVKSDNEIVMHRVMLSNVVIKGKNYTIRIQKSMIEDEDLLTNLLLLQSGFILILIIGLGLINVSISKKIWLPFNNIVKKMKGYRVDTSGKLDFMPTKIVEFKDLENSITELINRNNKLYKSQKEFTENASHELQTPIAIFSSKLELLMQTSPISEEQADYINEISLAGKRMQRINKTLLLLTKIENNQFPNIEKIVVKDALNDLIQQYHDTLQMREIHLETEFRDHVEVVANPILIDILLGNLLSNAIKYTEDKKHIQVELSKTFLRISNDAQEGVSGLRESDLFQRFKKQSNHSHSLGLGLEICNKIVSLYHFKITYSFENSKHYFTVFFE
ncbi:sensor histidine kinase [Chryseobacterium sp. 'Rf worker isolate 10']|uniref:sensor histidine kinase n=1 Tax=Chryseobacterium sp. 'Rf worker isolate 10' TaxID=2887348 RepID=UPI003D6FA8F9